MYSLKRLARIELKLHSLLNCLHLQGCLLSRGAIFHDTESDEYYLSLGYKKWCAAALPVRASVREDEAWSWQLFHAIRQANQTT